MTAFRLFLALSVVLHISFGFALSQLPEPKRELPPVHLSIAPPPKPPPPAPAPLEPPPPEPPPTPPKPRPKKPKRVRRRPPPKPAPSPEPPPPPAPEPEPAPTPPPPPAPKPAPKAPPPPPGPTAAQRKAALARYLSQVRRAVIAKKRYPRAARRLGLEGVIRVRVRIEADGHLSSARVVGDVDGPLAQAALKAVRDAAPFPGIPKLAGHAVSVDIPIRFRLNP